MRIRLQIDTIWGQGAIVANSVPKLIKCVTVDVHQDKDFGRRRIADDVWRLLPSSHLQAVTATFGEPVERFRREKGSSIFI